MTSQGRVEGQNILLILAPICFLWHNLWSVCHYITGPISGCSGEDGTRMGRGGWDEDGTGQQHLTAPLTTFSTAFSWQKMLAFWFNFHWSMFPGVRLPTSQHWFRWCFSTKHMTSHCVNQWWSSCTDTIMACGTTSVRQSLLAINSTPPSATSMNSAPSCYLNRCWLIVNWTPGNKFQWNLNRNSIIWSQENAFEMASAKMAAI